MKKPQLPLFLHQKEEPKPDLDPNDILVIKDLRKSYGDLVAVNSISFLVKRGSLFAFLGLNGAGKSTTINIITSILPKDSGKVYVDGMDLDRDSDLIKNEIGIVFQNSVLDPALTPKENLGLRAGFYGIGGEQWRSRLEILSDMLGLKDFLNRPVGKLSGGQKRRVDIARAMVHNPKLLILDEPTTGLDPQTRLSVWNLVNSLRSQTGMTVFLTTHYMEEAEKATFVVIMDKGNIIATGTPTELRNRYSGDYVIIHQRGNKETDDLLTSLNRKYTYNRDGHYYRVVVKDSADAIDFINSNRNLMSDFEVEKGNMDDVFLNVTGVKELLEEGLSK
jgi:multidrug/hemolysin transport system ATP-binding protein